jgi:hypothetical protein
MIACLGHRGAGRKITLSRDGVKGITSQSTPNAWSDRQKIDARFRPAGRDRDVLGLLDRRPGPAVRARGPRPAAAGMKENEARESLSGSGRRCCWVRRQVHLADERVTQGLLVEFDTTGACEFLGPEIDVLLQEHRPVSRGGKLQ